jgi:uncharacterized membrane protein HdeD (DUF308 family)
MASARGVEMVDRSYFYWRGGLSILLGVIVLVWPGLTILTLVTFLSIWLFLMGVISIVSGIGNIKNGGWGWIGSILLGILELGVGAYLIQRPGVTTLTIISLLGLVFVVQGFIHVFNTFFNPGATGGHRALSLLFGLLSLIAGIWVWRYPLNGTLAFVWLLGLYAIASGAMLIAMASSVDD